MHEKLFNSDSSVTSTRFLRSGDIINVDDEALAENAIARVGSVYLGDPQDERDMQAMNDDGRRLDIIDVRALQPNAGKKQYSEQLFDPSVNYIVEGISHDGITKSYVGLLEDDVLEIGRKQKIAEQFELSDRRISGCHATIYVADGKLMIEDNGSTHGTGYIEYAKTEREHKGVNHAMNESTVANWNVYLNEAKDQQYTTVQNLLDRPRFAPATGVEIDDKQFLFSEILQTETRKVAIGYVSAGNNPGKLQPRLFYKSDSDGGWRSAPYIVDGKYSKGTDEAELGDQTEFGQYVQLTKPSEVISNVLDQQMHRQDERGQSGEMPYKQVALNDIAQIYSKDRIVGESHNTFVKEVQVTQVKSPGLDAYISGVGVSNPHSREDIKSMILPAGFEPDFSEPSKTYHTIHSLAGETEVEVFPAVLNGRSVEWHVAHDTDKNRVWIDRIAYTDGEVTTYGTQRDVIVAGALSAKPFDHSSQLKGMQEGRDWIRYNDSYADVSLTLNEIPAIKHYRLSRGIYKK
ncbi:MAG: hypothetical protein JWM07_840 [Candidatus Saccharibacteria bacterium]|nr:hypothetical protein [Candidatus Saccharibacteria bacterium]